MYIFLYLGQFELDPHNLQDPHCSFAQKGWICQLAQITL